MATRAEQHRATHQRANRANEQAADKRARGRLQHENERASKKATYALEEVAEDARPTRKSTRASVNRAKPDAGLNIAEELRKNAPEDRYRRSLARSERVRGSAP